MGRWRHGIQALGWLLIALAAAGSISRAHAGDGGCMIYGESFERFGGPDDLDDGTHRVTWCADGATISGGSFCPTGGALRLDAGGAETRLRVDLSATTCTAVTIAFDYSQFSATDSVLRVTVTDDDGLGCGAPTGSAVAALDVTGGACTVFSHTVVLGNDRVVIFTIDQGLNTNALFIDELRLTVDGGCATGGHDCCATGAAGCDDPVVEACVCALDPFCCEVEWDALCVDEVAEFGCGTCGAPPVACETELDEDFGATFETGTVCAARPWIFETCEGNGPYLTSSGVCGGPGDQSMRFGTGFPYSAAITRCLALPADEPTALQFSYTKTSGTLGPRVEISDDDGPFTTWWQAPIAFGGGCAAVTVDLGPLAGAANVRLKFSGGSSVENGARVDDIALVQGVPGLHDCCVSGSAGCLDAKIESCVCAIDPFCCETAWDELCVIGVEFYPCGDCGICVDAFAPDFDAVVGGGSLCDRMPESFILCDGDATLATAGPCGGPGDAALVFGPGPTRASAIARCFDMVNAASASLGFTYAKDDGVAGPMVEVSLDAGGTWSIIWTGAEAPGAGCHAVCADLAPFTGLPFVLLRFAAGAGDGGGQSFDDIELRRVACGSGADLDGDGAVGFGDVLLLIGAWGPCPACPADLTGNGSVGFEDLLEMLGDWSA